jgi:hypothetical protein
LGSHASTRTSSEKKEDTSNDSKSTRILAKDDTRHMSLTYQLRKMNEAVASGDLMRVKRYVDALPPRDVRPVVESSLCVGFTRGEHYEALYWMASLLRTLGFRGERSTAP